MTDLVTVPANTYGLDWVAVWPDPQAMLAHGAGFAAIYLKAWNEAWVDRALEDGVAVVPIGEVGETSDSGGARAGESHARRWVDLARKFHVPPGCPIILTHDTSTWFGQTSVEYYTAGAHILRDNGYALGGYGGRKLFGNTPQLDWDLIWSWSAIGADPAPDNPHVQQGTHHSIRRGDNRGMWTGVDFVIDGLVADLNTVDTNVAKRPFTAWGIPKAPPVVVHPPIEVTTTPVPRPPHIEPGDDMANIGIIQLEDADAEFIAIYVGPIDGPRILKLHWIHNNATQRIAAGHQSAGATMFGGPFATQGAAKLYKADLRHCYVDVVPVGDSRTTWTSPDDLVLEGS